MADYIKITDYAAKDSLLTGDPGKLVKGSEIGAEFDAIETAIATKADEASPTFSGTVTIGTLTGLLKAETGAVSAAVAGTDYIAPSAIGTTVQAYDADLTTWAGVTPGAGVTTMLATPTKANFDAACSDGNFAYQSDIGVSIQAYDVDTAKLDVDQSWTGSQRGAITTDNDLSFDLNAANNFTCTPTAGGTLTFTNITAGQSGFIKLVNGSNYAIAAHANTKVTTTFLTTVSATGTYIISYYSDGTNVFCATAGAMA